jgi:hypothetical protein
MSYRMDESLEFTLDTAGNGMNIGRFGYDGLNQTRTSEICLVKMFIKLN